MNTQQERPRKAHGIRRCELLQAGLTAGVQSSSTTCTCTPSISLAPGSPM
jgi:hypothetical protein